jgi:hypothetical protein
MHSGESASVERTAKLCRKRETFPWLPDSFCANRMRQCTKEELLYWPLSPGLSMLSWGEVTASDEAAGDQEIEIKK